MAAADSQEQPGPELHCPASCLYQETRLNVGSYSSKAVVHIPIVTSSSSAFASRTSPKRRRVDRLRSTQDEASFIRSSLASDSSIHFRPPTDGSVDIRPRSVLWRVLDAGKTLELQPIDLYQDPPQEEEPFLTLRFELPESSIHGAIAFSEQEANDGANSLVVFVVTQAGNLITISLGKQAFIRQNHLDDPQGTRRWCHIRSISAFAARRVYRIQPASRNTLWASLIDGGLVRLDRQTEGNDFEWRQTYFTATDWKKSFRGMVAWNSRRYVRYGDQDIDVKSATTIYPSPSGKHIWTVCLDHMIRAWDVSTGRIAAVLDLAGEPDRDFDRPAPQTLDPNQPRLLQFRKTRQAGDDDGYMMVAYSPATQDFTFWAVDASVPSSIDIKNLYPHFRFRPPLESLTASHVWRLEQFHGVAEANAGGHFWRLWLLVRVGTRCQLLSIRIDANLPVKDLQNNWQRQWCRVDKGRSTADELKSSLSNPLNQSAVSSSMVWPSLSERWLTFLLRPGNFSEVVLETALAMYQRGLRKSQSTAPLIKPTQIHLRDRLQATIGQSCAMLQSSSVQSAFDDNERELSAQWTIYYGLVNELQRHCERELSLAYDEHKQLPWLVMAGYASIIRDCSQPEMLWHNRAAYLNAGALQPQHPLLKTLHDGSDTEVGKLFHVLSTFRKTFSDNFILVFQGALLADALRHDFSVPTEERVQTLYKRSGFAGKVSDDDYCSLTEALSELGGYENLHKLTFDKAIEFLHAEQHGMPQRKEINTFGCQTMTRGAQDTLALGRQILIDAGLLIVFTAVELVEDDYSQDFQPFQIFENIASKFREYELLWWLANTRSSVVDPGMTEDELTTSPVLLESLFGGDWRDIKTPKGSESKLLMYWIRVWTFGPRLTEQYDNIVPYIMAVLFTSGDLEHASELLPLLPDTAWASYVKARYYLVIGQFKEAADCFCDAAGELSTNSTETDYDPHNRLLQLDERNNLKDGSARFYEHVLNLFEKARAMSYVAHFAKVALRAVEEEHDQGNSLKSELLSCLFAASIHNSEFEEAFDALKDYQDTALRRSALQSLIRNIITARDMEILLSLPFTPELAQETDVYLNSLCSAPTTGLDSSSLTSNLTSPTNAVTPYKTLFAFRTHRSDHRGASLALYTRIQQLKPQLPLRTTISELDEEIKACYLLCINSLLLVEEGMRWLLVRPLPATSHPRQARFGEDASRNRMSRTDDEEAVRRVVTIDDVRREWQDELDRTADVEAGRYPLQMHGTNFGFDGGEDHGNGMNGMMPGGFGAGAQADPMEVDVFAS